ncbi:hypothetical protein QE152_g24577 [Popillia japonica]|uniref:Uncharacterized protein n=1 Tax=Popillia japonica TaxID=7064 RepID=A0AAW1K5Y5_POPJA
MSIKSPYSVAATYRIMPTTKLCKTANDIAEKHFRDELPEFCIARCVPLYSTMTCNNEGDGELVVCFCVLTPAIITTWLYYNDLVVLPKRRRWRFWHQNRIYGFATAS